MSSCSSEKQQNCKIPCTSHGLWFLVFAVQGYRETCGFLKNTFTGRHSGNAYLKKWHGKPVVFWKVSGNLWFFWHGKPVVFAHFHRSRAWKKPTNKGIGKPVVFAPKSIGKPVVFEQDGHGKPVVFAPKSIGKPVVNADPHPRETCGFLKKKHGKPVVFTPKSIGKPVVLPVK